jgi:segregation and condensation protein B
MEREEIKSILESLLFVADGPLTVQRFVEVLDGVDKETIQALILELQSELEAPSRGLQLVEVAGGYQLRTAKINADWVKKFLGGRPLRRRAWVGRRWRPWRSLPTASRLPKRRSNRSAVSTSTA